MNSQTYKGIINTKSNRVKNIVSAFCHLKRDVLESVCQCSVCYKFNINAFPSPFSVEVNSEKNLHPYKQLDVFMPREATKKSQKLCPFVQ